MTSPDILFAPIAIGSVIVKNRIFMPAMHLNMCRNHQISERLIEFYRERALGGAGLISVGYATVDEVSGTPANIGAHGDEFLPGLTSLARAIHEGGARATVQLNHAGRYNSSMFLGGRKPVAPSAVPSRLTRETPEELSIAGIEATVSRFAEAAGRVRQAGFDMVEILAGTGYLISEFLSPLTNRRSDEYGGDLANRMRFGLEVIDAVRREVGADFPIMVRLNGNDFMSGGIGPDEQLAFAEKLAAAGVDALCGGGWRFRSSPAIASTTPKWRGCFSRKASATWWPSAAPSSPTPTSPRRRAAAASRKSSTALPAARAVSTIFSR
jgi:2,4-dienoyl-CoA reductase (NADPH2)